MDANQTNSSPLNNLTNNFIDIYLGAGLFRWNVLCYDSYGNSAFASANFTLNITDPDIAVSSAMIWFSDETRTEYTNITIFANITNIGLSPANSSFIVQFFRNDPDLGGQQINGNLTISGLSSGETRSLNTTYILRLGANNLFVKADPANSVNETSESNNKANNSVFVELYQYYYGDITAYVLLATGQNNTIKAFSNTSVFKGNLFIADYDSSFSFSSLQALGKNKNGASTNNDFSDLDTIMNVTDFTDSINAVWANGSNSPTLLDRVNMSMLSVPNVSFAYSTNNTNFMTGILWDTSDDSSENFQFDTLDREDVVFVTPVSSLKPGKYGTYY